MWRDNVWDRRREGDGDRDRVFKLFDKVNRDKILV